MKKSDNFLITMDISSEINPNVEQAYQEYRYHKKLLNGNEKIKKTAEKNRHIFVLKKEADNGQALQQIKEAGENKDIHAEKPDFLSGEQEQSSGSDEYPDNKFGSFPS